MTLTTHAATGMLVTQLTTSPVMGFFAALLSHYIIDAIPHGDEFIYWRHIHNAKDLFAISVAVTDVFVLIVITVAAATSQHATTQAGELMVFVGVFGGILPDLLITLHTITRKKFQQQYAGVATQLVRGYHAFLQKHYAVHMAFHSIMRIPIRFRTALIYQSVFLIVFIYSYL